MSKVNNLHVSTIKSVFHILQQTSHKPRKEVSRVSNGKTQTPRADTSTDQESEKDKEIARLRWQNAQMKMRLESRHVA